MTLTITTVQNCSSYFRIALTALSRQNTKSMANKIGYGTAVPPFVLLRLYKTYQPVRPPQTQQHAPLRSAPRAFLQGASQTAVTDSRSDLDRPFAV